VYFLYDFKFYSRYIQFSLTRGIELTTRCSAVAVIADTTYCLIHVA